MAVPSLLNTWRVTYAFSVGSPAYPAQVVVHVTAGILENPQSVANEAGAAWVTTGAWKGNQNVNVQYGLITVQPYDGSSAPIPCTVSGFTGSAGSSATNAVPAQVAALITKKSLLAGRRNRGRMYVPGIITNYLQADRAQWTSAGLTAIQNSANAWYSKLKGGPIIQDLVVYSAKYNSKVSVSELKARQYFGTQRRRSEP